LRRRTVAVVNDTGGRGHYGCDLIMSEIRRHFSAYELREKWSHPVGVDWRLHVDEILGRKPVDVIVLNGEGSIHHSAWHERARYLAGFGRFAKEELNVPCYLINATITEIDQEVASDLRHFSGIYVRDCGSRDELLQYGIGSTVVHDLTVGARLPLARRRAGVAIVDSVVKEAKKDLRRLAEKTGWPYDSMHQKNHQYRRRWEFWRRPGFEQFARYLSSRKLVVTGRYHTATMCIATGTPFVAVESNTPKISWLLDDVFGTRHRLVPSSGLEELDVDAFGQWTAAEQAAVKDAACRARRDAELMFGDIVRGKTSG
jgi:hypothetical protein